MAPSPHDLYHTGLVVRDLDRAMVELTASTGVTWREPGGATVNVWTPTGERDVDFRAVFSQEGPHLLELVQHVDGTIWESTGDGRVHHLGYWAEDLDAVDDELQQAGFARVVASRMGGASFAWMYHQKGSGPYIEHVATWLRPIVFGAPWDPSGGDASAPS
jgi:hypothetical protein